MGSHPGAQGKGRRQCDQENVQALCASALWQYLTRALMLGQLSGMPDRRTLSPAGRDMEAGRVIPDVQGHPGSHSWSRTRTQDRRVRIVAIAPPHGP